MKSKEKPQMVGPDGLKIPNISKKNTPVDLWTTKDKPADMQHKMPKPPRDANKEKE